MTKMNKRERQVMNTALSPTQTAGVQTAVAAVTAISATASTQTAAAAPTAISASASSAPAALTSAQLTGGESPTEAEHNALQADVAALRTTLAAVQLEVVDLRARQAENLTLLTELKADHNAMQLENVDLVARAAEVRSLLNDIRTKYNALVAGIDGVS